MTNWAREPRGKYRLLPVLNLQPYFIEGIDRMFGPEVAGARPIQPEKKYRLGPAAVERSLQNYGLRMTKYELACRDLRRQGEVRGTKDEVRSTNHEVRMTNWAREPGEKYRHQSEIRNKK